MFRATTSTAALAASLLPVRHGRGTDVRRSAPEDEGGAIVVTGRESRTSVELPGVEMQKILPGVSPLKAIQTLPGVLYIHRRSLGLQRAERAALHPRLRGQPARLHDGRHPAGGPKLRQLQRPLAAACGDLGERGARGRRGGLERHDRDLLLRSAARVRCAGRAHLRQLGAGAVSCASTAASSTAPAPMSPPPASAPAPGISTASRAGGRPNADWCTRVASAS
ncbi:hypothetical protein AB5I41_26315 [Sphingomonas sp. MMS24-JH45]